MENENKFLDYNGLKFYHRRAKSEYDKIYAKKDDIKGVDLSNYVAKDDEFLRNPSGYGMQTIEDWADGITTGFIQIIQGYNDIPRTYAKKSEVVDQETLNKVIGEAQHIKKEVVDSLPDVSQGIENVIYLVKKDGKKSNGYDEYFLINGEWELIGDTNTEIDLSNYPTKEDLNKAVEGANPKIDIISDHEIDLLFNMLDEDYNPFNDNYLRVWSGENMIAKIESPTEILQSQFANRNITKLDLPDSVQMINEYAFAHNKLTSVTIPDSVDKILDNAFYGNELTSVTLSNNLVGIRNNVFEGNKLTSVTIPNGVTSIGYRAFAENELTSVTIPDSLKTISESAFESNKLTSVTIPDSVYKIEYKAFYDNPLKTVTISKNTKFESDTFPEGVEFIYR